MRLVIGLDAKRAYCNYRGLGNYSRLLIESLSYWHNEELSLFLFTPKVTLKEFDHWPQNVLQNNKIARVLPKGFDRVIPEIWRGYRQVNSWSELGLNIYHGLSNEIPFGLPNQTHQSIKKIKTIVTIHDVIFMRQPELYPWWDRLNYIRKVKYSCQNSDSIIALSEQSKSDLIEFFNVPENKIKVIYQAVHPRYYKHELSQNQGLRAPTNTKITDTKCTNNREKTQRPYFLFVGALEERKNVLRLIKAFSRAKAKLLDHELIIVGKGRLYSDLQNLIKELSLTKDVSISSDIKSEELPLYYQRATALLYPSLYEGFGLPIVEALMSETIVMTSFGSCFPESAGEGSFFTDPLDIEQMSQILIDIVNLNAEERQRRIKIGIEHCKKFHWKNTSENLVSHYKHL